MSDDNPTKLDDSQISKIDQQINEARQRKSSRGEETTEPTPRRPGRRRLTAEEKAERERVRAEEKAKKKAERDAARAARKAEREANQKPAHMAKVEKAAKNLPAMSDRVATVFNSFTTAEDIDLLELETLIAHLNHFVRAERTKLALETQVKVGQAVTITGGEPRFIGSTGTVEKVQRIRCYVAIEGQDKPVYLYTSDVRPLSGGEEVESGSQDAAQSA